MDRLNRYKNHGIISCVCSRQEHEPVVRNGLAYTPAQMQKLTERGMPVNSMNTQSVFIEGEKNPPFFVSSDRQRYVDICDLWEQHMQIRDKARKAALAKKSKTN